MGRRRVSHELARREPRISRIDADFLATEGTEDAEIRLKEVGQEGSLMADFADLRGFWLCGERGCVELVGWALRQAQDCGAGEAGRAGGSRVILRA